MRVETNSQWDSEERKLKEQTMKKLSTIKTFVNILHIYRYYNHTHNSDV